MYESPRELYGLNTSVVAEVDHTYTYDAAATMNNQTRARHSLVRVYAVVGVLLVLWYLSKR